MHLRLSHKLVLFALATAIFEGVLIGYFLYAGSQAAITEDALRSNQFKALEASQVIEDQFQWVTTHVKGLLRVLVRADEDGTEVAIATAFSELASLSRLELVSADGHTALVGVRQGQGSRLEKPLDVQAVHALLANHEVVAQGASGGAESKVAKDRIIIPLRVDDKGKPVAYCRVFLNAEQLTGELYMEVSAGSRTIRVVDAIGQVVLAPPLRPEDLRGADSPGERAPSVADLAYIQEMLKWGGKRAPLLPLYADEHGREVAVAWVPVDVPGLGWFVVVEQPAREAYAALAQLRARLFLYGGLGVFVTFLVGLMIVQRVTRPLEVLSSAARRIGRGHLYAEVNVYSRDEIGQLAATLREMRDRLREMYDQLEHRVEERTAELRAATDFLNSVLESSTEYAIIATDMEWQILTFNEGARRTFGYEAAEVMGKSFGLLVPAESAEQAMGAERERTLRAYGRYQGESTLCRKDGDRFPARTVTTVRTDHDGRPIGYTIIGRDITQQKALEGRLRDYMDNLELMVGEKTAELTRVNEQLVRANQLKGQFLATMSHELRTPLNAIIGFAEAIRDGLSGEPTADQREFSEDIYQAGRQLLGMINNILDLAKLEAGAMEVNLQPCDLAGLVDEVVRVVRGLAGRKGVELRTDVEPRPLELTADPIKLKQILYNLLSNAVKFTDAGGHVQVHARLLRETVLIRVSDTGIGIAPEDQAMVFEEFHQADSSLTRNHEGTGLGLALTKRLVELHGGEITLESELGKGTTFTVTLLRDLVVESRT